MKRKRPTDIRKPGEHWYELTEYFDPTKIETLPMKQGKSYLMGTVNGILVVQVSQDTSAETVQRLGEYLSTHGLEAVLVSDNIRFMKLRALDAKEERKLDFAQREAMLKKVQALVAQAEKEKRDVDAPTKEGEDLRAEGGEPPPTGVPDENDPPIDSGGASVGT